MYSLLKKNRQPAHRRRANVNGRRCPALNSAYLGVSEPAEGISCRRPVMTGWCHPSNQDKTLPSPAEFLLPSLRTGRFAVILWQCVPVNPVTSPHRHRTLQHPLLAGWLRRVPHRLSVSGQRNRPVSDTTVWWSWHEV